ncbi:TorF family putative porin [Bacillus subtilis subsp. subtilis]|nr:TorF family putative porin [Bacillus subtilis subsp. subtilis]
MVVELSKRRIARRCSALLLGLAISGAASAAVEGNATLTSDYVWRGSSQSDGDPAAQAGVKLGSERGWYASVWGSGVSFQPDNGARSEFDVVAGWGGALNENWALDVNLTRYLYPSSSVDLDWTELNSTLTWQQRYWLQVGVSDDALAGGHTGTYAQLGARLPLGEQWRLEAAVGHYWLASAQGDDYLHGQLSAIWKVHGPWELRLTAHDTDRAATRLFPGNAGSRVEFAVQTSF